MPFVCEKDPYMRAVHRHPTPAEKMVIDEYVSKYRAATGIKPHGLHYIPMPGHQLTVPIWFAAPE
jgi:hypothetical protein